MTAPTAPTVRTVPSADGPPPARCVRRRVATDAGRGAARPGRDSASARRAAHELGLGAAEFEAAVRLGRIRTVPGTRPWERRVARAELDRLRGTPGFTAVLRDAARLVNAAAGAELLRISPARFARLARGGCLVPLDFHAHGHRAAVWRYPAAELRAFAAHRPALLGGRLPDGMRRALQRCHDWRGPHWRARRTTQLVTQAEDPWLRAAVYAAVLPAHLLAADVPDPGERLRLHRLRPPLDAPCRTTEGRPRPGLGRAAWPLLTAAGPDETRRYRDGLRRALADARGAAGPAGPTGPAVTIRAGLRRSP